MGDGYSLSSVLLHSLLHKEQHVTTSSKATTSLSHDANGAANNQSRKEGECVFGGERDQEVRWMCAMARTLDLGLNTLGLSIAILDRILCVVLVRSKYLNCVAVASMYLAVKLHEEYASDNGNEVLDAASLVSRLRLPYSISELNRMERSLLGVLNWDLMLPSMDRFIQAMLVIIGAPHLAESLALRDNFEIVVSHWSLVSAFRPSILALALLSLMLQMTSEEWHRITQSLKDIFKIDDMQLFKCKNQMAEILSEQHHRRKCKEDYEKENNMNRALTNEMLVNKSRKRSRQAFVEEDYEEEEGHYLIDYSQVLAGKNNEETVDRDVLQVLYNILNAQRD